MCAATPLPLYYGCTAAGVCTAENVALDAQVTNPVAMFAADNNGIIVKLPNLQNANGDASVQGEVDVRHFHANRQCAARRRD